MARKRAKDRKIENARLTALEDIQERGMKTPLEFLLKTMWNRKKPHSLRIDAAKAAAPYVHRKMPLELAHSGAVEIIPPFVPSKGTLAKDFEEELDDE